LTFLTAFARRNPVVLALLAALMVGFGLAALHAMPLEILPNITLPEILVVAADPLAGPNQVAREVTAPLQTAVEGVSGLKTVDSESDPGFAVLTLTFHNSTDMHRAKTDVESAVRQAALPQGVASPSVITADFNAIPTQVLALIGPDAATLSALAADTVRPALAQLPGMGQVTLEGQRSLEVAVTPDAAKLAAAGLGPQSVAAALSAGNISQPAGTLTVGGSDQALRVQAGGGSLQAVADTPLASPAAAGAAAASAGPASNPGRHNGGGLGSPGAPAPARTVGDVAGVALVPAPGSQVTVTDGGRSVLITATSAAGADQVQLSAAIDARVAALAKQLPAGYHFAKLFDNAGYIQSSVGGAEREAVLGIVFAILIIFLFLRVARTTLVAVVSIPLSILTALLVLSRIGVTLNIMTLAGMAVAVGRVVDDSIVVIENVYRHLREEGNRPGLLDDAVREVASAVTTSTATTVAVFVPLGMVTGSVGKIFQPFALAVALSLLASLVIALTVVPLLLHAFLLRGRVQAAPEGGLGRGVYRRVLRWSLGHRWVVLLAAGALLLGSGWPASRLGTEFIPASGPATLNAQLTLPAGTPLADTRAEVQKLVGAMVGTGLLQHVSSTIGSSQASLLQGGSFQGANSAGFFIALKSGANPASAAAALRARTAALVPAGSQLFISQPNGQTGGANGYSVVLEGGSAAALAAQAQRVVTALRAVPGLVNVQSNLGQTVPELVVTVRRSAAAAHGLTAAQVAQEIAGLTLPVPLGTVQVDGSYLPVVLTETPPAPANLAAVRALPLVTPTGPVTLGSIADVALTAQPQAVLQHNQAPAVTVSGDITAQNTGGVSTAAASALAGLSWPAGMTHRSGGITQQQNQAFGQLGLAMLAALATVYLVMVLAFGGAAVPFAILFSLPLAVIGAVAGLWVTGSPIGLPALIGMLMLIGIVVTNAVVLVDLVQQRRRAGLPTAEALVEAGATRLRPILMTACATIGALLPLGLGLAEGAIISQSLAVVVIGGITTSTLLTLLVVPVMYSLLQGKGPLTAARTGEGDGPAARWLRAGHGRNAEERGAAVAVAAALVAVAAATGRDADGPAGRTGERHAPGQTGTGAAGAGGR